MVADESFSTPEATDNHFSDIASETILEACPACAMLIDMSDVMPFSEVHCPNCGQKFHARKQFNNFTLLELLGEGGMGSVFKAIDTNLNRYVALKILKRECSANAEEREKLAKEARLTAAINHPHVVKVFDFGQDHGQFYLAMEFVEKGSLDDLMAIQRRIAEAQVLDVGIQIAQGLEAAMEVGLIHRDIKPANILFANAHTAKLVDFGLAIVMDEEAHSHGEVWGTPYYVAPEKLDHQPEDFRSDMYSLGATLFHAVAGRPPYEAASASMVALKQLKSQPVSLQAFAPDVSSETSYVINRMMSKKPEDRYATYAELINHLEYARQKLLERTREPLHAKQRVLMETEQTRKVTALLSLLVLVVMLIAGAGIFLLRERIMPSPPKNETPAMLNAREAQSLLEEAVSTLASGDFEGAYRDFVRMTQQAEMPQPQKNWALLNAALSALLLGEQDTAIDQLRTIEEAGLYSTESADQFLANFFVEVSRVVIHQDDQSISSSIQNLYPSRNEAFALLLFAVWDWETKADFANAGKLFSLFLQTDPLPEWIKKYRPLAEKYLHDWELLEPIEKNFEQSKSPASARILLKSISLARADIQTGSKIGERLNEIENHLKTLLDKQ